MKISLLTEEDIQRIFESSTKKVIDEFFKEKLKDESKKEFLTINEAARLLHVSKQTIRNYITKGLFKAKKIKRRVLIERSSIDKTLEEIKSSKYKR